MSWVKRIEALMDALKGSSIGEIELTEGEFEISLRRNPGTTVVIQAPPHHDTMQHIDRPLSHGRSTALKAPLMGVYYASPSPTSAPFVQVGDIIKAGQVIALIEAMKVFNEIQAEVDGRIVSINAQNGNVIKKDEVLLEIEAL